MRSMLIKIIYIYLAKNNQFHSTNYELYQQLDNTRMF